MSDQPPVAARFQVIYHRGADLLKDDETQLAHRGLLVRVEPPQDLELYAPVSVEVVLGDLRCELPGQVLQLVSGVGVAIGFTEEALAALRPLVEGAAETDGDSDAEHLLLTETADEASPQAKATAPAGGKGEKIRMALKGKRNERMKIIRDRDRSLHMYVLKNPRLGLDEVAIIARNPQTAPDALKAIADRSDWAQRPDVALALVRNPKTPVPIAVRMVNYLSSADLRRLAKSESVRTPILRVIRRKVTG